MFDNLRKRIAEANAERERQRQEEFDELMELSDKELTVMTYLTLVEISEKLDNIRMNQSMYSR